MIIKLEFDTDQMTQEQVDQVLSVLTSTPDDAGGSEKAELGVRSLLDVLTTIEEVTGNAIKDGGARLWRTALGTVHELCHDVLTGPTNG